MEWRTLVDGFLSIHAIRDFCGVEKYEVVLEPLYIRVSEIASIQAIPPLHDKNAGKQYLRCLITSRSGQAWTVHATAEDIMSIVLGGKSR